MIKKYNMSVYFRQEQVTFFFSKPVQTGSGAHQTPYAMNTGVLSRGKKRLRIAVDHLHSFSPEVKNE